MKFILIAVALVALLSVSTAEVAKLEDLRSEYLKVLTNVDPASNPSDLVKPVMDQIFNLGSVDVKSFDWYTGAGSPDRKLRVCIVASDFDGLSPSSGTGATYSNLATFLSNKGHSVTVLYVPSDADQESIDALAPVQVLSLSEVDSDLSAQSYAVYQTLKTQQFDVIHFADVEGAGYYSTVAKKQGLAFQDAHITVGLHGPTRWVSAGNGKTLTERDDLVVDFMERMSVENADSVWSPSEYMVDYVQKQGWTLPSRVYVLPTLPGREVAAVSPSTETDVNELVFFGRLESRKGLVLFCDVLDQLAAKQVLDTQHTVTFMGSAADIDGEDPASYIAFRSEKWPFFWRLSLDMNRADALQFLSQPGRLAVMPSLVDNAPMTVTEALYARLPFIASDLESVSALIHVDDRESHLAEPTVSAFASMIKNTFKHGMPSAARPAFAVSDIRDKWTSLYGELSAKSAGFVKAESESPLVSVLITHRDRPALLLQAIESIEEQTYENVEVVLVDDGSTLPEATALLDNLAEPFSLRNWQLVRSESNQYVGAARNLAASKASGKYFLFLDDDNYFKPTAVETFVTAIQSSNADFLVSASDIFSGEEPPTTASALSLPLGPSIAVGLYENCFGSANFFGSFAAFNQIRFTEDVGVGFEDYEFHMTAAIRGMTEMVVPESLLWDRVQADRQASQFTHPLLNRLRSIRPMTDIMPHERVMRFLASTTLEKRAPIDGFCNTTDVGGTENCVNSCADCCDEQQCQCPGQDLTNLKSQAGRCNDQGTCKYKSVNLEGDTSPTAVCKCSGTFIGTGCTVDASDPDITTGEVDNTVDEDVDAGDNVALLIPSGTFDECVDFVVYETSSGDASAPNDAVTPGDNSQGLTGVFAGTGGLGVVIELSGCTSNLPATEFNNPIEISVPVASGTTLADNPDIYYYDTVNQAWATTRSTCDDNGDGFPTLSNDVLTSVICHTTQFFGFASNDEPSSESSSSSSSASPNNSPSSSESESSISFSAAGALSPSLMLAVVVALFSAALF